jgi:hypothetical protein
MLFKGRQFNHLLIIQAVQWYVTYKLSYRDVCYLSIVIIPSLCIFIYLQTSSVNT